MANTPDKEEQAKAQAAMQRKSKTVKAAETQNASQPSEASSGDALSTAQAQNTSTPSSKSSEGAKAQRDQQSVGGAAKDEEKNRSEHSAPSSGGAKSEGHKDARPPRSQQNEIPSGPPKTFGEFAQEHGAQGAPVGGMNTSQPEGGASTGSPVGGMNASQPEGGASTDVDKSSGSQYWPCVPGIPSDAWDKMDPSVRDTIAQNYAKEHPEYHQEGIPENQMQAVGANTGAEVDEKDHSGAEKWSEPGR